MRTVVVGASSGLGRCIGVGLAKRGAQTALLARRQERLNAAAKEAGPGTIALACDVTDTESCRSAIDEAATRLGGIDALVYTPAIGPLARLVDTDAAMWHRVLNTNVVGAALVTTAAVPHLTATNGVALYLSSVSASLTPPWPGLGAYAVSKAALEKLIEAWRAEHPTVGFTRVIVGDCAGGEGDSMTGFANEWDPDLFMEFHGAWSARKYLSDSLIDAEELVTVVDSVIRHGQSLSLHSVTVAPRTVPGAAPPPRLDSLESGHGGNELVTLQPYPYRARAWWGEASVAESDACLVVERPGEPALLYFPRADLDLSLFRRDGVTVSDPEGVDAESWSAESAEGDGVLSIVTATPAELASLRDHGRFDTERVRVEVLDGLTGTDARDVTTKRFPTWGDASHLVDMLDVHPEGDGRFVGAPRSDGRRPVVEGSQMLGQAIVAAGRLAPGRRAVSSHMVFLRGADARQPIDFELTELSSGRTFTALTVQVRQAGRVCAAGTLLLDVTSPEILRHAVAPPDVPGPYECPPYDMGVTGRDLRVVQGAYTDDADAPAGPPTLDCWVRFRDLPDDPVLHAGLLAQFTGHMPIASALRPHPGIGQSQAHRTVSMGINAINLALHAEVHADRWMLYHHESTFAGDGMTRAACRVHTQTGELLASFDVDAMVRPFADRGERDGRTAL